MNQIIKKSKKLSSLDDNILIKARFTSCDFYEIEWIKHIGLKRLKTPVNGECLPVRGI